ncbi:non-canonical purine NTP pyrophosphatase [Acrasis kona]|uniref:Non-canonical purine NTP pyrophosphatase n=1 Tax=Acrasis kona TaxID=1008807 RepID=A0AAW2YZZ1_9EUKA
MNVKRVSNTHLFKFPGDEELLEKISSTERFSRAERDRMTPVKEFVKTSEENAYQILLSSFTNDDLSGLFEEEYDKQVEQIINVLEFRDDKENQRDT